MPEQYPDLREIKKLECRGRTTHSHWDGVEIQREFYIEPFASGPAVLEALQGSVWQDEGDKKWYRLLPAYDPYHPHCFCNEARMVHIDPERDSITISPGLDVGMDRNPLGDIAIDNKNHFHFIEQTSTTEEKAAGGCFIHATYRPLVTGYVVNINPFWTADERNAALSPSFDYIDPRFKPMIHTVPWPDGLRAIRGTAAGPRGFSVELNQGQPLRIPVNEFTIKRLLVGQVPWNMLRRTVNGVNGSKWPDPVGHLAMTGKFTLPTFPRGTLRFDDFEVIPHYSRLQSHTVWYELVYHFSWLNYKDIHVFNKHGGLEERDANGLSDVTWNHLLTVPPVGAVGFWGLLGANDAGWFYVVKADLANILPWAAFSAVGPVHKYFNFADLFNLDFF